MIRSRQLCVNDVEWSIIAHAEDVPIKGNVLASGDDDADREAEERVREELENGNVWAWATVEVKGRLKDADLTASDYLGCCSYDGEEDFKEGGYYEQMQKEVLRQLQDRVQEIVTRYANES